MTSRIARGGAIETSVGDALLSRRSFVVASVVGAILGGRYATETVHGTTDSVPESPVLAIDDLVGGDEYVEWRVDPRTAPLSRYLGSAVSGFSPEEGIVAGFVATAAATGPTSVESAVFQADESDAAVLEAIDEWVRQDHTGTTTRTTPGESVAQWVSVSESSTDVLRLDSLPGNSLAVTTAAGDPGATLGPIAAVERYAETVRNRAIARSELNGEI